LTDLVLSQLTDLFRIGLIIALVVTMHRTAAVTGRVLPLFLGVMFVAVMLPAAMPNTSASLTDAILAGLVSNTIILAAVLVAAGLIARLRR
jgi:drug/metabolite transporter (DMT)-like permease